MKQCEDNEIFNFLCTLEVTQKLFSLNFEVFDLHSHLSEN